MLTTIMNTKATKPRITPKINDKLDSDPEAEFVTVKKGLRFFCMVETFLNDSSKNKNAFLKYKKLSKLSMELDLKLNFMYLTTSYYKYLSIFKLIFYVY